MAAYTHITVHLASSCNSSSVFGEVVQPLAMLGEILSSVYGTFKLILTKSRTIQTRKWLLFATNSSSTKPGGLAQHAWACARNQALVPARQEFSYFKDNNQVDC